MDKKIVYLLGILALALQTTAISTKEWSQRSAPGVQVSDTKFTIGLWNSCSGSQCLSIPFSNATLRKNFPTAALWICRIFAILGAVLILSSIITLSFPKSKWYKWTPWLLALGGICSLIATVVWVVKFLHVKQGDSTVKFNPGYSLILNAIAGLVAIGGATYMFVKK